MFGFLAVVAAATVRDVAPTPTEARVPTTHTTEIQATVRDLRMTVLPDPRLGDDDCDGS